MASIINQQWVFGQGAGLDFSTAVPTPRSGFLINTGEGCASISNGSGNLLLYTDGMTVWNGANAVLATGLQGNSSSTQSGIIVPDPGNSQQFYIFTADGFTGGNQHLNAIRIDVSSGAVTQPLSTLLTNSMSTAGMSPTERVTAIQHRNCRDFWVITVLQRHAVQGANSGQGMFRVLLVNSTGVQWIADTPMNTTVWDIGYLKASPNGKRLALANSGQHEVLVYDFDNALGTINISSQVTIPVPTAGVATGHPRSAYGVEFSPDNALLYYSILGVGGSSTANTNNGYVFQVDLSSGSSTLIVTYPNPSGSIGYAVGALQLGIDGRIYIAKHGESSLGAILYPSALGLACNPSMSFITLLSGTTCNLGLPNLLPNPCDCSCDEQCEQDIENANQILNADADGKRFTIVANGQTVPTVCQPAFNNPALAPVFTMEWGDGPNDQFESSDLEIIYFRIHNPFSNVVFREVVIFNIRITPNQPLPGGGNTLTIIPAEIACFDEIGPCSYVSRDFALIIDHALVGPYQISFDYCIGEMAIVASDDGHAVFDINVVAS